jgi:thiol-disulfide isomerase/thioredoxin
MNTKPTILAASLAAAALAFTSTSVSAAELGMDAPHLSVANWVKGDPVVLSKGRGSQIYVVEFWATWCGPCRVSIPHLTELQKKYKDKNVTIVGISDEVVGKVRPFVDDMGAKMDYTVAVDNNRTTYAKYMKAFNQNGIPTAFVIDKMGKIVWYGHPMADLESVLDQVVAGTFNGTAYKQKQEQREAMVAKMSGYLDQTIKDTYPRQAKADGTAFVKSCNDKDMLNHLAWTILTHPKVQHRDQDVAMAAAKKAYELSKGMDPAITDTYARAFYDSGDKAKAIQYQQEAVNQESDSKQKAAYQETLKKYRGGK